jgi:D-beta-D-heptose 7-phosphate kinase/D-beta-D-heptose 1-phosphate adenosyltransferase
MSVFDNHRQVLAAVRDGFQQRRVLVVGDLILDRYLWGDVHRISPESPVPVVQLVRENEVGGGAANVAMNLATFGVQVAVAGYVGEDHFGGRLLELLGQKDIDTAGIVKRTDVVTVTKTRIIGGRQQMLRIDREDVKEGDTSTTEKILSHVARHLNNNRFDAIILSDYAKGVLSDTICREIISIAHERDIPVLVDPKGKTFAKYRGATAISPNRQELATAAQCSAQPLDNLLAAGRELVKALQLDFMAVTLGEQGIALVEKTEICKIPALAREVFDVSGAGDTVIATLAAGLAAGLSRVDALHLANLAAGVVVGKVGTATVSKADLLNALSTEQALQQSEKICPLDTLLERITQWRAKGERIVFTNGCFDLLHAGHVTYLAEARRLGNRLIVGLNTDRSVRALKGPKRPVIKQEDRARVLAALAAVDAVVLFDEDTPRKLIRAIRPEVLAKGSDYTVEQVVGAEEIKAWNGEVALIELVAGKSSTRIVNAIRTDEL